MIILQQVIPSYRAAAAAAAASPVLNTDYNKIENRNLFEIPSAFDYYNHVCQSHCNGDDSSTLFGEVLSTNPCPKCKDKYSHEHCNHW